MNNRDPSVKKKSKWAISTSCRAVAVKLQRPPLSFQHVRHLIRTFLPIAPLGFLGGGGSKIRCCCCGGNVEYSGMILMSPTSGPRSSTSRFIRLQASSISYMRRVFFFFFYIWVHRYKHGRVQPTTRQMGVEGETNRTSCPVRKSRQSPSSSSHMWIWMTVRMAASR